MVLLELVKTCLFFVLIVLQAVNKVYVIRTFWKFSICSNLFRKNTNMAVNNILYYFLRQKRSNAGIVTMTVI